MGAITEEWLLNVPVFKNEIPIQPGPRSTGSRGIRSEVGREVEIARIVRVPHPQLDLMASQRIPTVIELFAQRRVKIPGCHFNWDIQQAFFSYRTHRYNTDFGSSDYVTNQLHPELYYGIAVKRNLVTLLYRERSCRS